MARLQLHCLFTLLLLAPRAAAQAPESSEAVRGATNATSATALDVTPPRVLAQPEPDFPEGARLAGVAEAVVVLRVTVDAEGAVTAAEVVEPSGQGFDEAAVSAALQYRFEPARRGDVPVAARILLRVEFRPPPSPEPAKPLPAPLPPPVEPPPPTLRKDPRIPVEIRVVGESAGERKRRSAEAVTVIETEQARRQTADLGEVLARSRGVGVQRSGGLGSESRFSLNGLTDDQIRFFLDGVPLELAGYPFGIANVPVNLVERVELYRGVVPVRFGADALGGAVNLVSDQDIDGAHAGASLQAGSFGTYRATVTARHLHEPSSWFTRVSAFADHADNDYPMNIEVPDAKGRLVPARVHRFHDAYAARGANAETGIVNRPWARRLLLRAFVTRFEKEIQHNLTMTFSPYGDVVLSSSSAGTSLRYENRVAAGVTVKAVAGYAYTATVYQDLGQCIYDWFGQCVGERAQPGERRGRPEDQLYREHAGFARIEAEWRYLPGQSVRFAASPTAVARRGDERRQANPDARDALSAERQLVTVVSGVEHQLELFASALQNVAFFKDYLQAQRSEDPLATGLFARRDRTTHRFGLGDALRYSLAPFLYAKGSYEWATRLPRPDEVFGNAFPIQPNLELEPELSHNFNLGVTLDYRHDRAGSLRGDLNTFLRDADRLIVLVGDDKIATYQNVYRARSRGFEAGVGWTSPGNYIAIDGNATWVDFRNTSRGGPFAKSYGARIPNRPYLFGTGSLRLQAQGVAAPRDELSIAWTSRYVHEFYRGWEGLGTDKLTIDAQLVHSLALTYLTRSDRAELSFTGEAQNLTDQPAFDVFGVPRPGRAFYFKATTSL